MRFRVQKRNGNITRFNAEIIRNAIENSIRNIGCYREAKIESIGREITNEVLDRLHQQPQRTIHVERIQDTVVNSLSDFGYIDLAINYEAYRRNRTERRESLENLDPQIRGLIEVQNHTVSNENANKDSKLIPVMRDLLAGITSKDYAMRNLIPKDVREAHIEGILHFHDMDYSPLFPMFNCMLIDLKNMLDNGFKIGNTEIESPKSIMVACAVTAQIIAQVASHIYGGNSINCIDQILAPYVRKSFQKHFKTGLRYLDSLWDFENVDDFYNSIEDKFGEVHHDNENIERFFSLAHTYATELTQKECIDAFQALEYEINTLFSTNGQTPFTTFGMYFSTKFKYKWEARQIQASILKNRLQGMGKKGKTAIFPKLIYAVEEGNNLRPSDPNYDLKKLALECASKRMYPDKVSVELVKETTGSFKFPMGCRSFLSTFVDEQGNAISDGRFNMGVVTINLPRIAIQSKSVEEFFMILNTNIHICQKALLFRVNRLKGTKAKVAPILYCQGAVGTRLDPEDVIDPLLENGRATISLGYIGIHEAVKYLLGKAPHESEEASKLALHIVEVLDAYCRLWKAETGYGFGVYGTPAESLCNRFVNLDRKEFGIIEGVTDKEFYTNSFHIDVQANMTPFEKMDYESKFPKYSSGGFISYVELNSLAQNPDALEAIWDYAQTKNPYFAINTPADKCYECDFEGEFEAKVEGFTCPNCGNSDPTMSSVVRRVCGYLGEPSVRGFHKGKQHEVCVRKKHL